MTKRNEGGDPKEKADVPPVLPSEQQSAGDSAGALSPEELDFTESPYVDEISDGRYVVSADRRPPNVPDQQDVSAVQPQSQEASTQSQAQTQAQSQSRSHPQSTDTESERDPGAEADADAALETDDPERDPPNRPRGSTPRSPEAARSLLADELEYADTRFAIDIVSRFDDDTVRHRMTSDDVVGTFNSLVFWYARHVSGKTPTNRAASLLLERSDFTPPLSESRLRQAMRTHGLDESSQLEELLEALEE